MRTATQKPKSTQQTEPAGNAKASPTFSGQRRDVHSILQLKRTIGNQAAQQLLRANSESFEAESSTTGTAGFGHDFSRISVHFGMRRTIRPKLKINAPGDMYEQEADQVAHHLSANPTTSTASPLIQRYSGQPPDQVDEAPSSVSRVVASPGTPLQPALQQEMEGHFGYDFSQVRVHHGPDAEESARDANAAAYTVGHHIVFGTGRYSPKTLEGKRLFAHELTHVVQQGSKSAALQRQPAANVPNVMPATAGDREFVRDAIDFFNASASYFSEQVPINQALFEQVINSWYRMVVNQESMIDNELGGDVALKTELRVAYTAAIRVLISRAAIMFGKSENDLYRENSGRIPMWAWQTPHHLEPGISTPIAEGRIVDVATVSVNFSTNGFDVAIAPDTIDRSLGDKAKTRVDITWGNIDYISRPSKGGGGIVTSFTGPPTPIVFIQTRYGPGVTAASPSGYGRGTTPEDIAGGRLAPRSTSLGFHEGSHGLDYVDFLENNPPPQFTGTVGMSTADFKAAITQWQEDNRAYEREIEEFSTRRTD
jgi:hypothetical protein